MFGIYIHLSWSCWSSGFQMTQCPRYLAPTPAFYHWLWCWFSICWAEIRFHLRTFWSPPLSCYSRLHCDRILSSVATSMTLANSIDFGYSVESVSFANLMWHIPSNILSGWYIPGKWNIYCWHDLARWETYMGDMCPQWWSSRPTLPTTRAIKLTRWWNRP